MRKPLKSLLLFSTALLFFGCATSPRTHTKFYPSTRYAIAADSAAQKNDWATARKHWAMAVESAEAEKRIPSTLAELYFEYGRSLAVIGEFNHAERYWLKALEIDMATNGNVEVVLSELARINLDQGKLQSALTYYDQLLLKRTKNLMGPATPASWVAVLHEYSMCLNALGRVEDARSIDSLIERLKQENAYPAPSRERMPYGKGYLRFPIPSHRLEVIEADPEPKATDPVDLNLYLAQKPRSARDLFIQQLITEVVVKIITSR